MAAQTDLPSFRIRARRWLRIHRVELLLFLLLWTTYAYFYQSTQHNEASRFDQTRAIVENRALAINKYWWNTADVIHYSKNGSDHIYPAKAPGMSLLAVPAYAFFSAILTIFRHLGLPEWVFWHLLTYLTTVFTVSLLSALAAVAMFRLLRQVTKETYFPVLVVLAIWLGTIAFPFSTLFFSHQLTAALLALAFCLIFQLRQGITLPGRAYAAAGAAGFLIGFSVTTEYPTAILAGLLSLYFLWTAFFQWKVPPKRKAMIIAFWILGGAIGGGALIAYNLAAFGKPFYLAYEALARSDSPFPMHSHGWVGMQWPGGKQFVHAVAAFMIFPPVGLLYIVVRGGWVYACNPVLWLALPGLVIMLWKKEWRAEGVLITAMTAAYILFLSCYGTSIYDWAGASYLGPRHIIPLLPFLALPLYFGAVRLRFIFYPLCALSVFYMLIATAIEPRSPTPFEIPARDFFLPDYLRGRLAQNPQSLFFWNRTLTKNSNAFNLAKVAGIPGRAQLAPLMVWWLLVGGAILLVAAQADAESEEARPATGAGDGTARRRRFRSSPRVAIAFLFLFAGGVSLAPAIHHAMLAPPNSNRGLAGKYYRNDHWAGAPEEIQIDPNINFDWSKSWPLPSPFSIEWTGQLIASLPGDYTFSLIADDGALVEIDGRIVVDVTKGPLLQEKNGTINLSAGLHRIRVRYFNTLFGGSVKLSWSLTGRPKEVVPTEALVPEGAPLPKGR